MELTDTIDEVASALTDSAIWHGDRCCWLAPTLTASDGEGWATVERTGDATLYDGSAGIALACATVGVSSAHPHPELVELAAGAIRHAVDRSNDIGEIGLYDGIAGTGLAALTVGILIDDTGIREEGGRLLDVVAARATIGPPPSFDLTSGLAGVVVGLGRAAELFDAERWGAHIAELADHLELRAHRRSWGASWADPDHDRNEPDLCGLAHGVSGVLLALGVAGTCGADPDRYGDSIRAGRQYERSWFDPTRNAWPDLRDWDRSGPPPTPARWCHGAAGIGLARTALAGVDESHNGGERDALLGELGAALQSACAEAVDELDGAASSGALPAGLTLCHGLGGAVDLLAEAAMLLDEPVHLDTARHLVTRAVAVLGDDVARWPGGVRGLPSPGLMNGLAGVLVVLARLDAPAEVGSAGLLRLAVPRRHEAARP